ncbi:hypothetical protein BDZ97DRAFT_1923495 [Flammula alnicola]|nr:hypothetical protein BDZ97DRAFT_1923495 [Flammula alnicola]
MSFSGFSIRGAFTLLDLNGIHTVNVLFCDCEKALPTFIQLLRFGWFPATVGFPRTAVTFRLLRFFQLLSFESKSTVFEFHKTLSRLTDNTGTKRPKNRYATLLRVVREYGHMSMLKRGGRGHDRTGAAGTRHGELALLCPACPQVGINLPDGWENTPKSKQFLYGLFIGLDANFRLKRKIVSSHLADPGLSQGWAYFVEEDGFKSYLQTFGTLILQEPSTCSNHNAVNKERAMEGYAASGAGTCDCTRHDMKRPNGVGDLQKGERLKLRPNVPFITVSYDIACQWSIHLWDRMKIYPTSLQFDPETMPVFRFLIPKFHLRAHIMACQTIYSLNYNKGCARTDGEGVERGWDHINPVATSTREMGPGNRRDTVDGHFGDFNWRKTSSMGTFLLCQIKEAVLELAEKSRLHVEFSHGLPEEDVAEWTAQLDAWEDDHSKPNPFEASLKGLSQQAVRRQLADEETKSLKDGTGFNMHEDVSASQLVTVGLELENQQHRLKVDQELLGIHATDDQKANLHLLRSRAVDAKEPQEPSPSDIPLFLPSSIPSQTPCDVRLKHIEWRLRYAQCGDALDDLRDALCMRSFVLIDKKDFSGGSGGIHVKKYRTARTALSELAPVIQQVGWDISLPVLNDVDVRPLTPEETKQGKGKKNAKGGEVDFNEDERLTKALGLSGAKAYKSTEWEERASRGGEPWGLPGVLWDDASVEGRVAYAREQSAQFLAMKNHCLEVWKNVEEYVRRSGQTVELAMKALEADEDEDNDVEN